MEISVRPARPDDADAICDAHVAAWRAGYAHIFPDTVLHGPTFDSERRTRWRAWSHSPTPDRQLIVGVADGAVVGCALAGNVGEPADLADGAGDVGELFLFYLHPDRWGSGVATAMMNAAVEHLAASGHGRAVLWTLEDAHRARSFYERSGWKLSGRTDTLMMYPDHPAAEVEYQRSLR